MAWFFAELKSGALPGANLGSCLARIAFNAREVLNLSSRLIPDRPLEEVRNGPQERLSLPLYAEKVGVLFLSGSSLTANLLIFTHISNS